MPRSRPFFTAALAMTATVALLTAAFSLPRAGALAWLALAPVLAVLPRLSTRGAEWLGFLTGLAFYAIGFRWFAALFGAPAFGLWALLGLFTATFCVLARSLPPEMPAWKRAALVGCFWVALEFVRCEQWPLRFSWLALGYAMHDSAAGLRAASVVGVYGLSFLMAVVAAVLATARRPVGAVLACAAMAATLWPVAVAPDAPGALARRVVMVQSPSTNRRALLAMGDGALQRGIPTLLVWPEYVYEFTEQETPEWYAALFQAARRRGVTLVFGGVTPRGGTKYSSAAFVVGPNGRKMGVYEKHNPLPFFQDGQPGTGYPVFHWRAGGADILFGVTICYDLSFERNARVLAARGARLLVVPSMEPEYWPRVEQRQHAMVAPLRAAENGVGIVRCSTPGPSQIVSANGAVRASLASGRRGVLASSPPLGDGGRTAYNRFGWLLPWLCQAVTLAYAIGRIGHTVRVRSVRLSATASAPTT